MSEPQLERSVLEAKERDELLAIASALGANPAARAKKADLITAILRATGIEVEGSAEDSAPAPKRRATRTRKTAASNGAGEEGDGESAESGESGEGDVAEVAVDVSADDLP